MKIPKSIIIPFEPLGFPLFTNLNVHINEMFDYVYSNKQAFPLNTNTDITDLTRCIERYIYYIGGKNVNVSHRGMQVKMRDCTVCFHVQFDISYEIANGKYHVRKYMKV